MASKTPLRRPRSPARRLQDRQRRLQDRQDRLQDASNTAQDASKRPPDASKTAKIASRTPPRPPKRLPNASKTAQTSPRGLQMPPRRSISLPRPSKMFGSCFKSLLACQAHANYCQVLAKSLPGSQVFQRCFVRSGQTQRTTAMAMAVYQGWSGGVCPLGRLR